MKNRKLRLFYDFLVENNVLEQYKFNRRNDHTKLRYPYSIELPGLWIDNGFLWEDTPQEYDFWQDLSWKWDVILESYE